MKTRLSLLLGLLVAVTPASVAAQADTPASSDTVDRALVSQLCTATAEDADEVEACISAVEAAATRLTQDLPVEEQSLLDQLASTVDDTLEDLRQVDIEAAFDDVAQSVREFELDVDLEGVQQTVDDAIADVQTAIDELEMPTDVDIQGALEDAVAEALSSAEDIDLQAAVDDILTEAQIAIEDADLQGAVDETVVTLEQAVSDTQAIVAEARAWAQENRAAVCRGGSLSLGTTVGIAVFAVTGVEWLGLQAFWAAERLTNGICGDVVGDSE